MGRPAIEPDAFPIQASDAGRAARSSLAKVRVIPATAKDTDDDLAMTQREFRAPSDGLAGVAARPATPAHLRSRPLPFPEDPT
jgi:hypothetical protein